MKMVAIASAVILNLALAVTLLVAPGAAQTVSPESADLARRVAELEKNLASLKAELASRGTAPATPVAISGPAAADAATPSPVADASSKDDGHTLGPLQFRGYSDFGFGR